MILCDVCVLLNAMVEKAAHHDVCRKALESVWGTPGKLAVSEFILAAVVRIGTNPRVFDPCPSAEEVFAFVNALRLPAHIVKVAPGPRHWRIFEDLVGIEGSDTTDAYLAALAIEHGCEWWTTDRGFDRFAGLQLRILLD